MRLFNETTRTYATQENALKAFAKATAKAKLTPEDFRHLVAVNSEGRFFVVVTEQVGIDATIKPTWLCFEGVCVM